jgi:hypothetical protein
MRIDGLQNGLPVVGHCDACDQTWFRPDHDRHVYSSLSFFANRHKRDDCIRPGRDNPEQALLDYDDYTLHRPFPEESDDDRAESDPRELRERPPAPSGPWGPLCGAQLNTCAIMSRWELEPDAVRYCPECFQPVPMAESRGPDSDREDTQRRTGRPAKRLNADEALLMKRLGALQANLHREIRAVESHAIRLEARLDDLHGLVTDILEQLDKHTPEAP